ncbi:hypothetical protein BS78_10G090000 [Paspalum vaginatum]|nr:hypothetical protein BS78_10G090000 [Paspalum vaginatum]
MVGLVGSSFLLLSLVLFSSCLSSVDGLSKVRAVNLGGWLVVEGWIKPSLFDGIPNGDMLDGTQVQIRSVVLNKYVSAANGGGSNVTVDRDVASTWETFRLWRVSENEFQLRCLGGQFLTSKSEDGLILATKKEPLSTETFYIERNGGRVHIKLLNGGYVQDHRRSFITASDFDFLSRHGINTVRIPVGWWITQDPYPPSPFIGGSLAALDLAFSWAHASRDGSVDWPSPECISQSLEVIDFLATRYGGHPSLLGIELLNEPSAATVPLDILVSYYMRGYQIVRNHSSTAYVILCQRIGNADPIELFQAGIGLSNVVVDLHYYNLFDPYFASMNSTQNVEFIYKMRAPQLQALKGVNGPLVFVGEWVNEWDVQNASQYEYQKFGRAQLDVYANATFGWSYWTLKNDRVHWDFEWNIQNKYLLFSGSLLLKTPNLLLPLALGWGIHLITMPR